MDCGESRKTPAMDRSQFLLMALVATAIGAVQLGCGEGTSGDYHTFSDSQTDDSLAGDTGSDVSRAADSEAVEPDADRLEPESTDGNESANAADTRVDAAGRLGDPSVPIEPEMTPEEEPVGIATTGDNTTGDNATGDNATGSDANRSLAVNAADSAPPTEGNSAGSKVPSPPDVTLPATADPTATEPPTETPDRPVAARPVELLIPEQTFSPEGSERALRVSFDDLDLLKVLNMEPVPEDAASHFPKWLSGLDEERIRIRGFMYPTFQETDLPGFVLARDNEICCFGRNPKIYDLIEVSMRNGVTTDYIQGRPFDVIGVLHIKPEADEGELYQLYQIDDAVVVDR